jgi:isopenicillin N synthase-like dioxygenase
MVAIPVIDIGPLVSDSPTAPAVAATIGRACRETGFFYVVGHGIAPETVATAFAMSRAFFAQPLAAKQKAAFSGPSGNRGWIKLGSEILDPGKPHDLKEAFNIGLELPPDDPEVVAGRPFRGLNCWPDIPGFRAAALTYFDACWRLGRTLHRAFAMDLGLAPDFFESLFTRPMASIRMLHYPPAPAEVLTGQLGAGEHTDYGNVTLLVTDEVPGLMVRHRSGEWIAAPSVADAFVCNIGDMLMRWTNDIYVSTPHKVVSPPGQHRYSIAFFLDANPEAIVECLPTCITPGRPAKYPPVSAEHFLHSRLAPTIAGAIREGAVPM